MQILNFLCTLHTFLVLSFIQGNVHAPFVSSPRMSFAQIFKAYSKVLCLNLLPLCVAFVAFWRKNKKGPGEGPGEGHAWNVLSQ